MMLEQKETETKSGIFRLLKTKGLIPIAAAAIVIIVAVVFVYLFAGNEDKKEPKPVQAKACGEIKAENNTVEGTTPFAPKLSAKLTGNYPTNKAVCQWKIDGADSHSTYPVNGSCIYALRSIATIGEHTISYNADGLNCSQSIKIKVNKK